MYIEMNSIKKAYKVGKTSKTEVLRGVNLNIDRGEMLAIKGPSGSGKSTLLHIIGCLDKADSGSYMLHGKSITGAPLTQMARIRNEELGFVMQDFALIENDSAIDNVMIPLLFTRRRVRDMEARAYEKLSMLKVGQLAKKKAGTLSGGEKQRVAIARALINDPDLILADEPTGALDSLNTEAVMDVFEELNRSGKTIVIVTHEDYVASRCQRIIHIEDGRVI